MYLEGNLTKKQLLQLINDNREKQLKQLNNKDYYDGEHSILKRKASNKDDPNKRIVTNFIREIVDKKTNITLGNETKVFMNCEEDRSNVIEKLVRNILKTNNFEGMKTSVLKDVLLYGESFIYVYQDEKGYTMFEYIPAYEGIIVYKDRAKTVIDFFVRYYKRKAIDRNYEELVVEVVDSEYIYYYIGTEYGDRLVEDYGRGEGGDYKTPHIFHKTPVIHFKNNSDDIGSIKDIIPLNDHYNSIISYIASMQEKESKSKLVIKDMQTPNSGGGPLGGNQDEIEWVNKMKESDVFLVRGSGDVSYIKIPMTATVTEQISLLKTIEDNIYRVANIPNPKDDLNLGGNISGVSIKARNQNMEIEARKNKNIILNGLLYFLDLIKPVVKLKTDLEYNVSEFDIDFNIIVPMNELETIQSIIEQYKSGLISLETAMDKNPTVVDTMEELERIQRENNIEEDTFYSDLLATRHNILNNHK